MFNMVQKESSNISQTDEFEGILFIGEAGSFEASVIEMMYLKILSKRKDSWMFCPQFSRLPKLSSLPVISLTTRSWWNDGCLDFSTTCFFCGELQQNCQATHENHITSYSYSNGTFGHHSWNISGTSNGDTHPMLAMYVRLRTPTPKTALLIRFSTSIFFPYLNLLWWNIDCQLSGQNFHCFSLPHQWWKKSCTTSNLLNLVNNG